MSRSAPSVVAGRLLAPSEVFHAFLDWQTTFRVEIVRCVAPAAAEMALSELYAGLPGLGAVLERTPDGFALAAPAVAPVVVGTPGGARVDAALSAVTVRATSDGVTRVSGRLHHVLSDVTAILVVLDRLVGLLTSDGPPPAAMPEWPTPAEELLARQPADALAGVRTFYATASPPPLVGARPVTGLLPGARVAALDAALDAAHSSLTAMIAAIAARQLAAGHAITVGVPVDCRTFLDADTRAVGNCSHGALLTVPGGHGEPGSPRDVAEATHAALLGQLDVETPLAPFLDGRRYLPELNPPADLVVSNARGAARRFGRLSTARTVRLLPGSAIPGLPMIAVNEDPVSSDVTLALVAHDMDLDATAARAFVDSLVTTLHEIVAPTVDGR